MKFEEITPGKKYFVEVALDTRQGRRDGMRKREMHTVYVLEVNEANKTACASINKAPAAWYNRQRYMRWQADPPEGFETYSADPDQ